MIGGGFPLSRSMKQSRRVAIGGLITALSIVLMFATGIFPFSTFALPALAGILLIPLCLDMGLKWGALVYAAVSILALLLTPDREAAFFYLGLFGHYPILKGLIESRCPKKIKWVAKFIVFHLSLGLCLLLTVLIFGLEYLTVEYGLMGGAGVAVLLIVGNAAFLLYDICLTRVISAYLRFVRPRFKKFF